MNRKRIVFAAVTMLLIITEVLIALYVHDSFVRPYLGDVIVVIVIWSFLRAIFPEGCRLLPLWVFIFAFCVEVSQYFGLVELLGLDGNRFFRILLGGTFDISDIICYAAGCVTCAVCEVFIRRADSRKAVSAAEHAQE